MTSFVKRGPTGFYNTPFYPPNPFILLKSSSCKQNVEPVLDLDQNEASMQASVELFSGEKKE